MHTASAKVELDPFIKSLFSSQRLKCEQSTEIKKELAFKVGGGFHFLNVHFSTKMSFRDYILLLNLSVFTGYIMLFANRKQKVSNSKAFLMFSFIFLSFLAVKFEFLKLSPLRSPKPRFH